MRVREGLVICGVRLRPGGAGYGLGTVAEGYCYFGAIVAYGDAIAVCAMLAGLVRVLCYTAKQHQIA